MSQVSELTLEFVAHQLYMQSLNGGYGVRWMLMRKDLQNQWLSEAERVVNTWEAKERECASRQVEVYLPSGAP